MSENNKKHGVNLFLLELIIVLLFFSISGVIILNMLSVANSKADKSVRNEKMILCSQSISELFSVGGSMDYVTERLFGNVFTEDGSGVRTVYVDRDFNSVADSGDAYVTLNLSEKRDERECGVLSTLYYEFIDGGEVAFSCASSAYTPDFEVSGYE